MSKLQIENEELTAELEKVKQHKINEVAKVKKDLTSRLETAEKNLKQEQIRNMETLQDIENKHHREIELLKSEHACEMRGLDADLTQSMTEKFDLEQRLAALA